MARNVLASLLLATVAPAFAAQRAMWVWEAAPPPEVLSFSRERGITHLFLQWSAKSDPAQLRAFLKAASGTGIAVHALDGWPEAALAENHGEVLNLIDAILRFNRDGAPEERFAGIHFDIEPYLLAGFESPLRAEILRDFVGLQKKTATRLAGAGLEYGADLPFWFDNAAMEEVLRHAQNVGIMDYRNLADTDDGIIAHARKWIGAGDRLGKKVWIAVETAPSLAAELRFVAAFGEPDWRRLSVRDFPALRLSRFEGFRLQVANRNGRWAIGLETPAATADQGPFRSALASLRASALKAGAVPEDNTVISPAIPKISFHGRSLAEFDQAIAAVEREFRSSPSFVGIAIHHYDSYRTFR
jgi:hypothetical protein